MILLTGASGFIGKHLLLQLIKKYGKNNVIALTSRPIDECNYILHNDFQFDPDFLINHGYTNIKTIIHAGAFTPKNGSQANDVNLSNSNIYSTEKLLNLTLPYVQNFIFLSTLDVYDNAEIISENTSENPISLYGFSKLYCEKMVEQWGIKNNKVAQILRIGHVYGPGEEAYQKIIPISINKILNKESLQIWGTGNELRSFIYINDVVNAIINSLEITEGLGIINLVSNQSISINELISKLIKISKKEVEIINIPTNLSSRSLVFDNTKMINWLLKKETNLDDGLNEEFEYVKTKYFNQ